MESGTAELMIDPGPSEFLRVSGNLGCDGGDKERVACMMKADGDAIHDAVSNKTLLDITDPSGGTPAVDNITVFTPEETAKRGKEGKFAKIVCPPPHRRIRLLTRPRACL